MNYDNYKIDVTEQLKGIGGLTRHVQSSIELLCDILNRLSMPILLRTIDLFTLRTLQERALVKKFLGQFEMFPTEAKTSPLLLMEKGKLLFALGDFEGAAYDFLHAASGNFDRMQRGICRFNQFQSLVQLGKLDDALKAYQEAITSCPDQCELFDSNKYTLDKILGARIWGITFQVKREDKLYIIRSLVSLSEGNLEHIEQVKADLDSSDCPYLQKIYEFARVEKNKNPYLVTEYLQAVNLKDYINTNGEIVEGQAVPFLKKIAEAMNAAQNKQIIHGDLKPKNILVIEQQEVLIPIVINWGLSLERERIKEYSMAIGKSEASQNNFIAEDIVDSIEFRAPEQQNEAIEGNMYTIGSYSDTYAFGRMACYVLFKTIKPFAQQWEKLVQEELRSTVEVCCLEHPKKRYQNFKVLLTHFSIYRLGYKHFIKNEFQDAIVYFKRAIKNENEPLAKFGLFLIYKGGRVMEVMQQKAEYWLRETVAYPKLKDYIEESAATGDIIAQTLMGYIEYFAIQQTTPDYPNAQSWFQKSAEKGCTTAQTFLGHIYRKGQQGLANPYEAFTFYKKAANKEYAPAQYMLGYMYFYGQGTEQDFTAAIKWYERAAEKKHVGALIRLGYIYRHGLNVIDDYDITQQWLDKGITQDYTKAISWFQQAANLGDPLALTNLACMYLWGLGVKSEPEKAISLLQEAANKNYAYAQYALVYIYRYGIGVAVSHTNSFKWIKHATLTADSETRKMFELILKQKNTSPQNSAKS